MDFQTKKFWAAQVLALIITIGWFADKIDFDTYYQTLLGIQAAWGVLDVATGFAKKKKGDKQ